jgi:ribosome maturation factor RimP
LLLALAIPLGVIMGDIVRDTARRNIIHDALAENVTMHGGELINIEYQTERDELVVVATTRSDDPISQETVDTLAAALEERLNQSVTLELVDLPVVRSTE